MAIIRQNHFDYGVPRTLGFKAPGKNVPSKVGDPQVCFATIAGDSVYLDEAPAGDIEREMRSLGIAYGEEFRLTRAKTSHGGSRFVVERASGRDSGGHNVPERHSDAYEQRFSEPVQRSAPTQVATVATPATVAQTNTVRMMACFLVALDAVNEAQSYAKAKGIGITFTSDNVTSAALSCFINECKGGR